MGCQSQVVLGQNLVFSVTTHDPDTGVVTDADAVPAYRIYEDETGTAILSGTMTKLDDTNTTGFYTEQIACTAANGFEADRSYTIYIEATVDSDKGAICYGVRCMTAVDAEVWAYATRTLTAYAVTSTSLSSARITRLRGDTWSIAITNLGSLSGYVSLDFTIKGDRSDADGSSILWVRKNASGTGDGLLRLNAAALVAPVVVTDASITIDDAVAGDITIAVAARATALLVPGPKHYDVQKINGGVTTLADGTFLITGDVTRATS